MREPETRNQKPEIILRAPEPTDLDFLYQLENDPDLWAHSDVLPAPVSRHALKSYLENAHASLADAGQLRLLIEADGQPVGTLDLYDHSARHQRAGVGIAIVPGARRRGYAAAALAALLPYARLHLRLHQLYCTISAGNRASISLFEKAGFQKVGTRRDWVRADTPSGWENVVEMQLLL